MLESIIYKLENCDDIFKSKNSKNNLKKYIRNVLNNVEPTEYVEFLKKDLNKIKSYLKINLQINFNYKNNVLNIYFKKLTDKEINRLKLKNKLNQKKI